MSWLKMFLLGSILAILCMYLIVHFDYTQKQQKIQLKKRSQGDLVV